MNTAELKAIALKYTPINVRAIHINNNYPLQGRATYFFSDDHYELYVPRPNTLRRLLFFLHECSHAYLEHKGNAMATETEAWNRVKEICRIEHIELMDKDIRLIDHTLEYSKCKLTT